MNGYTLDSSSVAATCTKVIVNLIFLLKQLLMGCSKVFLGALLNRYHKLWVMDKMDKRFARFVKFRRIQLVKILPPVLEGRGRDNGGWQFT